jgi:hypothetical protein
VSRTNDPTSLSPGDDQSPEARLIDAALTELDADLASNPYAEVVAAATSALVAPVAVRPDLAARIAAVGIEQLRRVDGVGSMRITPSTARTASSSARQWVAWSGWIVAAAACVALAFTALRQPAPSGPAPVVDVAAARQGFIAACSAQSDPAFVRAEWGPGNTPDQVRGDVVWSDQQQRGYLRFAGLPVNDPEKWVYQLWIFDAQGDDRYPVDGGVFNIASVDPKTGEAIVEIDPKIKVGKGVMFAVTIEKPGGVVVSDRSKIVALARAS